MFALLIRRLRKFKRKLNQKYISPERTHKFSETNIIYHRTNGPIYARSLDNLNLCNLNIFIGIIAQTQRVVLQFEKHSMWNM